MTFPVVSSLPSFRSCIHQHTLPNRKKNVLKLKRFLDLQCRRKSKIALFEKVGLLIILPSLNVIVISNKQIKGTLTD